MTVKELIEELQQYPDDIDVRFLASSGDMQDIVWIKSMTLEGYIEYIYLT